MNCPNCGHMMTSHCTEVESIRSGVSGGDLLKVAFGYLSNNWYLTFVGLAKVFGNSSTRIVKFYKCEKGGWFSGPCGHVLVEDPKSNNLLPLSAFRALYGGENDDEHDDNENYDEDEGDGHEEFIDEELGEEGEPESEEEEAELEKGSDDDDDWDDDEEDWDDDDDENEEGNDETDDCDEDWDG